MTNLSESEGGWLTYVVAVSFRVVQVELSTLVYPISKAHATSVRVLVFLFEFVDFGNSCDIMIGLLLLFVVCSVVCCSESLWYSLSVLILT